MGVVVVGPDVGLAVEGVVVVGLYSGVAVVGIVVDDQTCLSRRTSTHE